MTPTHRLLGIAGLALGYVGGAVVFSCRAERPLDRVTVTETEYCIERRTSEARLKRCYDLPQEDAFTQPKRKDSI